MKGYECFFYRLWYLYISCVTNRWCRCILQARLSSKGLLWKKQQYVAKIKYAFLDLKVYMYAYVLYKWLEITCNVLKRTGWEK